MAISVDDPKYVFGDFRGAHDVDDALIGTIDHWILSYVREVARRSGEPVDQMVPFNSHRITTELEHMPEDQSPGLIVVNTGLAEIPSKSGTSRPGKSYNAVWGYQFGVLVTARGSKTKAAPRAQKLAKMYTVALRLLLIQKRDNSRDNPEFKDVLGMLDWINEDYNGLDSEDDRTICLAHTDFQVWVPDAATWATGPLVPDIDDTGDPDAPTWPVVTDTDLDIIKVPTDEEV